MLLSSHQSWNRRSIWKYPKQCRFCYFWGRSTIYGINKCCELRSISIYMSKWHIFCGTDIVGSCWDTQQCTGSCRDATVPTRLPLESTRVLEWSAWLVCTYKQTSCQSQASLLTENGHIPKLLATQNGGVVSRFPSTVCFTFGYWGIA